MTNIVIYDDENIVYKIGQCTSFDIQSDPIDCSRPSDGSISYIPSLRAVMRCDIANYEELNNIELDETTMKRIAKYNKEQECKRLDEKIKEKEDKIKELDNILTDKEKRVDKLKKYIAEIFDIDINEDDDFDYYDD